MGGLDNYQPIKQLVKRLSTSRTHSPNNMLSIQFLFWLRYRQGKCSICLQHREFLDLPIKSTGNLFPTALAAFNLVRRSLLCLPPTQFSIFRCREIIRLNVIKPAQFVVVVNLVKVIFGQDSWQSSLLPICKQFISTCITFTRNRFK